MLELAKSFDLLYIIAYLMALLIAMSFHEFAHAFVAKNEGDYTATALKRCTLKPLSHIDISGFVCLILFGFGWAKPVPVDPRNFKRGNKSSFLVSIAGIVMNLALGIISIFLFVLIYKIDSNFYVSNFYGELLYYFLNMSAVLNFSLALFNLLPIYPFDGFRLADTLLGDDNAFLQFVKRYSYVIYIVCLVFGIFTLYLNFGVVKLVEFFLRIFAKLFGV